MPPGIHPSPVNGLELRTFSNGCVAVVVAPELGGHLVSIRRTDGGREWLDGWQDGTEKRLWKPTDPANFETGCGAGLDECLPTVLPCMVNGSDLPDHGELWNRPGELRENADGFTCVWTLESLPLRFTRRITLDGHRICFDYRVENLVDSETPFQWAWHPLFALHAGDHLELHEKTDRCFEPGGDERPWPELQPGWDLSQALLDPDAPSCAKVFLGPFENPRISIIGASDGQSLTLLWSGRWMPYAGVWITRGAWKNLHHWAIEPTNAPVDRLAEALTDSRCADLIRLNPHECRDWTLTLDLESFPI